MGWKGFFVGSILGGARGSWVGAILGGFAGDWIEHKFFPSRKSGSEAGGTPNGGTGDPLADAYATLGVLPTAEDAVVAAAYRQLAKSHHPDVVGSSAATDEMSRINAAWNAIRTARGL